MNALKPHVSLNVSNIEAAVAFYEKAFNVAVTERRGRSKIRKENRWRACVKSVTR